MTLISHPYSLLFTTFPLFFLYSALPHGWRRRKKMKRSAEYHTTEGAEEEKRLKRGKVDGYRGRSLIIYRPSLSPPMSNHLSTPKTNLTLDTNP